MTPPHSASSGPRHSSVLVSALLLVIVGSAAALIGAELLAQMYAYHIVKQGKIYQPDDLIGWTLSPNVRVERLNADQQPWLVETTANSIRGSDSWKSGDDVRRVLILGDSFAFGEGVNLEDRFDAVFLDALPNLSTINLGIGGQGPDQQLIRARQYLGSLRAGDIVFFVLFIGNDFNDLARKTFSARSKPWVEIASENLIEHPPEIDFIEILRDKSFLFSILAARIGKNQPDLQRLRQSEQIMYRLFDQLITEMNAREVAVWLAFHGDPLEQLPFDPLVPIRRICEKADRCIDLRPELAERSHLFLRDGHWNAAGHRLVARRLIGEFGAPGNGDVVGTQEW